MIGRRFFLAAGAAVMVGPAFGQRRLRAEVWRDPNCGCCGGWIDHLRGEGFDVTDHQVASVGAYRQRLGTPSDLLSCHAAQIERLVIEGHVPAQAILRALDERPEGVVGLAVPAMPIGTPGMEMDGVEPEIYDVIAWRADGSHFPWLRMRGVAPV